MSTNAHSSRLAVSLQDLYGSMNGARFVRFCTRLAGEVQKGVRRGDHKVEMVLLTGISYMNAVEKTRDLLKALAADPDFVTTVCDDLRALGMKDEITGLPITDEDVRDAVHGTVKGRKGLLVAAEETLAGTNADDTCADVYEPLVVDGQPVPGCKVYIGPAHPQDPKAPQPGNVYLSGVVISSRVVEASPNGSKVPGRRGAVAVVKEYLSEILSLPVARFRTPRIHLGEQFELVHGAQAFHAIENGPVTTGRMPVAA